MLYNTSDFLGTTIEVGLFIEHQYVSDFLNE